MEKRNRIKIKTVIDQEENNWESDGLLAYRDGNYIMEYPDYAGNTQTDNRLKFNQERMHLMREGTFTTNMVFEENMMTGGLYKVMFYDLNLGVYTKSYIVNENERFLKVKLAYDLYDRGIEVSSAMMEITIEK